MQKIHRLVLGVIGVAALALAVLFSQLPSVDYSTVQAAQLAAPTPIAYASTGGTTKVAEFFNRTAIRADTRVCKDLREFRTVDMQYIVDEGTVNTATLKLQFTNNGTTFVDGTVFATAVAVDTSGLGSYPLVGIQACVFIDVTNANTVTLTAIGLGK